MAVLFLAGPASAACTGVHLPVDAGLSLPPDHYARPDPLQHAEPVERGPR
jgi:hypothetical protein